LAEAHYNLGTVFQAQGKLEAAVSSYQRAVELNPNDALAHNNLGAVFHSQGKLNEAVACFWRAVELKPDLCEAHKNLGSIFQSQGKLDEAVGCFRRVLELIPDSPEAHGRLGNALKEQGELDEAIACYRRALELRPDMAPVWDNLLFVLQYRASTNLTELAAAHAEYDRAVGAPFRNSWKRHENDRDAERSLRVGFVSPNLGLSPVGFFLIRAMENLGRIQCEAGQCEVICYSDRKVKDRLTPRFEAAASIWREVSGLSDQEVDEQIRADRIDILIDLAGHTAGNRLLVFARKPAPIQVTWAGYAGTTGLEAMDYILADRYEIPPEAEGFYSERVLRMPDGYVCYEPPSFAREVTALPALSQGCVTFGSFNNPAKITSPIVEAWAAILDRVAGSRLVLKHQGMNYDSVATKLAREFSRSGVDPRRIECLGWSPHGLLMAEYARIDLALDTYPYSGGLTTCEALWMGVPVIACPGETFASRHSMSHLSNVGLTETIARDLDEYVELAVSLARDLPRLAALRAGLRDRMAASPLCDGKRFAENLMRILREIWREWCYQAEG
jgi:predicted O-linked N-acetylglucosamine transferase (SPINDLY family)